MGTTYWGNQSTSGQGQGRTGSAGWDPAGLFTQNKAWEADPYAYMPGEQYDRAAKYIDQGMGSAAGPFDPNAANIAGARGAQQQGRGSLLDFLTQAQNRPLDSAALGQTMMRAGQQQVAGNVASQLASQQGRQSPAAFRNAQNQIAGAGQNMALQAQQQAMAAAIQERAAREAMLQRGYQGLGENDLRRMMAEQAMRQGDQGFWSQQQQAQQGWGKLGLGSSAMEQAARQAYEQAKMSGFYGTQPNQDSTQMLGAALAAAGYAMGSDVRLKENIRPATSETRSLLALLAKEM